MKRIVRVFRAISDPTRLRILALLLEEELCVCELQWILGMSQSRVSHQLRILKDIDLVIEEKRGKWIYHKWNDRLDLPKAKEFKKLLLLWLSESEEIGKDRERLRRYLAEKPELPVCPSFVRE